MRIVIKDFNVFKEYSPKQEEAIVRVFKRNIKKHNKFVFRNQALDFIDHCAFSYGFLGIHKGKEFEDDMEALARFIVVINKLLKENKTEFDSISDVLDYVTSKLDKLLEVV